MPNANKIQWPQGEPQFELHWRAVAEALAGNGILTPGDLEVTATANDLEIQVAAGSVFYSGSNSSLGSSTTFTLSSGDANDDRWDTVYFDTGTESAGVREGTPAGNPEPPDIQGDEILLATVYVPATATDVPDAQVLNWRTQHQPANNSRLEDSAGNYTSVTVEGALAEAFQGLSELDDYDLNGNDFQDSAGPGTIYDASAGNIVQSVLGGPASSLTSYPLPIGDLNAPFALSAITDMDTSGNDLNDSSGPGTIYDATNQEIVQTVLGGPASSLTSYPLPIGDLNAPFALPSITDTDLAGNDLTDSSGPGVVYDAASQVIVQAALGGPASSLSAYPLVHGTDTDAPADAHHIAHEHPGDQAATGDITLDTGEVVADYANKEVPKSFLGGPASSLTSYPLPIGDLDSPYPLSDITDGDLAGSDLSDSSGPGTIYDASAQELTPQVIPEEDVFDVNDHNDVDSSGYRITATRRIDDGETFVITRLHAVDATAGPLTSDISVTISTFDDSGGSQVTQATAFTGDGTNISEVTTETTYQNTTGATQTVALTIENSGGSSIAVILTALCEIR